MAKKSKLGAIAQENLSKEIDEDIYKTEDKASQSETKSDKKRRKTNQLTIRLREHEIIYLEKAEKYKGLRPGPFFHHILQDYINRNPL